jgi:arsenate reductase
MNADHRTKVLFLCTGNSCRSQMAEGWARSLHKDQIAAYSAGTVAKGLDPRAVAVMAEAGVDITDHRSKTLADLEGIDLDLVITVCAHADANCPIFPGHTRKLHRGFDDPPNLAQEATTADAALVHYRRVRDEIRAFVASLPDILAKHT